MFYDHDEIFFHEFIEDFVDNLEVSPYTGNYPIKITNNFDTNTINQSINRGNSSLYKANNWNNDLIDYPHKRSYEEKNRDDDSESSDSTLEKSIISFTSFKDFIGEMYSAFNQGSISKFASISEKYIDSKCVVRLNKPDFEYNEVGPHLIIRLHQALINSHPDAVMTLHKTSTTYENGQYIVQNSLRFRGTRLYSEHMSTMGCMNGQKTKSLMGFFDQSKISQAKLAEYQQLEQDMIAKGEVPMMFIKISLTMVFDEISNKAKYYGHRVRLSSFRSVDPKAI